MGLLELLLRDSPAPPKPTSSGGLLSMLQSPGAYGNNPMAVDNGGQPIPEEPAWAKAVVSGVDTAAKVPPAAVRVYLGTLLGDKSAITEKSLRPDELAALAEAVKNARAAGRQYVTYGDYDPTLSIEKATSGYPGPKILSDVMNTPKSLAGVLGRAKFETQPDGSTVLTDQYDFENMSGYVMKDGQLMSVPETYGGNLPQLFADTLMKDGPYQALRVLGEVAAPEGKGRSVSIRLK